MSAPRFDVTIHAPLAAPLYVEGEAGGSGGAELQTFHLARTLLARAAVIVDGVDEAIREIEPVPQGFEAIAAQVYARAGRPEQARGLLAQATRPHNLGNPPYQIGAAFAALEDSDQAMAWLERAV